MTTQIYHYKSSAELKRLAKGQLLGKYSTVITSFLMYISIIIAVMMLYGIVTANQVSVVSLVFDFAMMFVISLFSGIFSVGYAALFLNIACGRPYNSTDIFYGFRHHADKAIMIQFLLSIIRYAVMAPYMILNWYNDSSPSGALFLASSVALIIGYAITIYVNLLYCQWVFIVLDFPEYSAKETLRLSRNYMKGHKWRRFYIALSFAPLIILSFLSCGIALLWIMPYQNAVYANFYLDLVQNRAKVDVQI